MRTATVALALLAQATCFGGGPGSVPRGKQTDIRWPVLTEAEHAAGCVFMDWNADGHLGANPAYEDWSVGGLIELRCPDARGGTRVQRACSYGTLPAPVSNPLKHGIYRGDILIGCAR